MENLAKKKGPEKVEGIFQPNKSFRHLKDAGEARMFRPRGEFSRFFLRGGNPDKSAGT
jgi:hypothetical protein